MLEKLARGSVGAMGGRQWLPTTARSSPEGRSGRLRRSGLGVRTTRGKEVQMGPVWSPSSVVQKREGEEVGASTERGGNDVAASGWLGRSWRSRRTAAGRGNRAGVGKGQRVEAVQAGGRAAAAAQQRRRGAQVEGSPSKIWELVGRKVGKFR
jgi:hypothetical protein